MKEIYGKYEGNMTKYISRRLGKIPGLPAGGGRKSYADAYASADTIPEMALCTEREGGSPANKN